MEKSNILATSVPLVISIEAWEQLRFLADSAEITNRMYMEAIIRRSYTEELEFLEGSEI